MAIVPTLPFSGAQLHAALKKLEPTVSDRAPLPSDDETQGYAVGSRWQWNGQEWVLSRLGAGGTVWLPAAMVVSVKHFGAIGNGVADDTAAIRVAMDWALAQLANLPNATVHFPRGVYLVTDELLSDDFQEKWWAQTGLRKGKFIAVTGEPAGASEIRVGTGWLSGVRNAANGNVRAYGPWAGGPSPSCLWPALARNSSAPAAFSVRDLRLSGTGRPGRDPIPFFTMNELDARSQGLHVVNFANWGEVIMGSFNSCRAFNHYENCGTQPVESGRVLSGVPGYPTVNVHFDCSSTGNVLTAKAKANFSSYAVNDPVPFFKPEHVGKRMVIHQGDNVSGVGQPLLVTIATVSGDGLSATFTLVGGATVVRSVAGTAASFMPVKFTSTAGSATITLSAPVRLGRGAADMVGQLVAAVKAGSNASADLDCLISRIVAVGSGNDTDGYTTLTLADTAKYAVTDALIFGAGHACISDEASRAASLTWNVNDTDFVQCRYEHSGGYVDGNSAGSPQFLIQNPGEAVQYVSCKFHGANTLRGHFASEGQCIADASNGVDLIACDFTHFGMTSNGVLRLIGAQQDLRLLGTSVGSWQQPHNWIGYYLDPQAGYSPARWNVQDDRKTRVKNTMFPRLAQKLWAARPGVGTIDALIMRSNAKTLEWDDNIILSAADDLNSLTVSCKGYWGATPPANAPGPYPGYGGVTVEQQGPNIVQTVRDLDNRMTFRRECFSGTWGAWRYESGSAPASSTANLSNATNLINTHYGKVAGMPVRNTTDSKLYYAVGPLATDAWRSADGASTITPA